MKGEIDKKEEHVQKNSVAMPALHLSPFLPLDQQLEVLKQVDVGNGDEIDSLSLNAKTMNRAQIFNRQSKYDDSIDHLNSDLSPLNIQQQETLGEDKLNSL